MPNVDAEIVIFLKGIKDNLENCNFGDSEDKQLCKEQLVGYPVGTNKHQCGYTAGMIQDTVAASKTLDVMHNKWQDISVLPNVLTTQFSENPESIFYVMISRHADPIDHVMVWIITNNFAHTLQSWVDKLTYNQWSIPLTQFTAAITTISSSYTTDEEYKLAFNKLTYIPINDKLWTALKFKPKDSWKSKCRPTPTPVPMDFIPKFTFVYAFQNNWSNECTSGGTRRVIRIPYEKRTMAELKVVALKRKIKVTAAMKKVDLIAALRKKN